MRILVWNMQAAFGAATFEAKWRYLKDQRFDVALLQEAPDPTRYGDWRAAVWSPRYAKGSGGVLTWGSAVISRSIDLREAELVDHYPWLRALPGSTAIARTSGRPVWLASVHASATKLRESDHPELPLDHIPRATPHGSLWQTDVLPHQLRQLFGHESFVWGGDLNSAEDMDSAGGFAGGNRKLREIWRQAGSHDLRLGFFEDEQRTFFSPRKGPWQLDHVFADAKTAQRVTDWHIDTEPIHRDPPLSDHAPVIVEIDLL